MASTSISNASDFARLCRLIATVLFVSFASTAVAQEPFVFVHGIEGSKLVDPDGSIVWLTLWQALGFSTPHLELDPRYVNGVQPKDNLQPSAVLDSVGYVKLYGPFLKEAPKLAQPYLEFLYDWRRDPNETVAALVSYLENLKLSSPTAKVRVVAHSMGGMITLGALNLRPDLFSRVIFVGVPFGGGIGFLPDIHAGRSVGLNSKIGAPIVLATFPAVFSLFPFAGDRLINKDGTNVAMDFFAVDGWRHNKLGPFADGEPPAEYTEFFRETLAKQKQFRSQLVAKKGVNYPPILVLAGINQQTRYRAVKDGPKAEKGWDFESSERVDGDGRVALVSALPPEDLPHTLIKIGGQHTAMLYNKEALAVMKKFLNE